MRIAAIVVAFGFAAASLVAQVAQPLQAPFGQAAPGQPVRPPTPTRDQPTQQKGTAIIRGQILDAASGQPLRRARVAIFAGPSPVAAQTDAEGRFELREVPAGKHTLNVTKTGYLSLLASNNNKPVPPIEIIDGQVVERVVVRLSRGGVISGQVVDEFGEPFVGAQISALRYRYVNGQRQLMPAGGGFPGSFTDDLGSYRLYGLEPGEYYISARGGRDMMPFAPAVAGEGPAPTYFPGTSNVAEARRVTVAAGRETQGVSFAIALARLSRVRGRVVSSSGEPFSGSVMVASRDSSGGPMQNFGSGIRPDGSFEVGNLPPGSYYLVARPNLPDRDGETGRVALSVNGEEVNDVVIVTSHGGVVRGRIVTDDGSPLSGVSNNFTINVASTELNSTPLNFGMPTRVNSDGTFEVKGVFDRVHLRVGFQPARFTPDGPTWTMKAITVGGQDVTDTGLEIRPGQVIDNAEIIYTRRVSRLTGRLTNSRGEPANGWIVVFANDESKWTPLSRFVRVSRPGADGEYRLSLVPHDDYSIVGVDGLEEGQWQDPEFLRGIKESASRLAIGENETKTQDLTVVDWRR